MAKFDIRNEMMVKFFSSKYNRDYLQAYINREGILRCNYGWYLTQGEIDPNLTPINGDGTALFKVNERKLKPATLMNLRAPLGEGYQKEKGGMKFYMASIPDFAADGFREKATERWYRKKQLQDEFGNDADLVDEWTDKVQDLVDSLDSTMTFMSARISSTGVIDWENIGRGIQDEGLCDANVPKENFKNGGALAWTDAKCDLLEQMRKMEEDWRKANLQYKNVPLVWQITKDDYFNVLLKNKQIAELWKSWAQANYIAFLQNYGPNKEMFLKSVTDLNGLSPIEIVDEEEQNMRFDGSVETIKGWANGTAVLRPAGKPLKFMRKEIIDKPVFEELGNKYVECNWATTNNGLGLLRNKIIPNGEYNEFKTDLFLASIPALLDFPYRWIININKKDGES